MLGWGRVEGGLQSFHKVLKLFRELLFPIIMLHTASQLSDRSLLLLSLTRKKNLAAWKIKIKLCLIITDQLLYINSNRLPKQLLVEFVILVLL